MSDDHQGPVCVCGQQVAVPHRECMSLLTPSQRKRYDRGLPPGRDDD